MQKNHITSKIVTFWNVKWRTFNTGNIISKDFNAPFLKIKKHCGGEICEVDRRDIIPGTGRDKLQYLKMLEYLWADWEDEYWNEYNKKS